MPTLGSGSNEIKPFATGVGANVETAVDWASDTLRNQGFQPGIAPSKKANTAWRQAAFMASMIAQFSSDFSGEASVDDGDVLAAEQRFIDALGKFLAPMGVYFITDTGSANAMVGTSANPPPAYSKEILIVIKKMNANNSGPMTANFWGKGIVSLTDNTGSALAAGSILGNAYYILACTGSTFRVLGGVTSYTSVTNLTANSGDMIAVTGETGVVDFRTLRGAHDATPNDADRWPRGEAVGDAAKYMTSAELLAWIESLITFGGGIINIQVLTSSGTYTKTAGTKKALVIATAGGGSGACNAGSGGSGGAGSTAIALVDMSAQVSIAFTIGAGAVGPSSQNNGSIGGQTSFGSYAVAGGGEGGTNYGPGFGGVATVGLMLIGGGDGEPAATDPQSGTGGGSFWGGGGSGSVYPNGAGFNGRSYGAGGGGGDASATNPEGGDGAPGVILVVEFG